VTYRTGTANQEEFHSSLRYLEKATREFPDDYKYYWLAGTRYYFDLWSPDAETRRRYHERGAELIEEAMTKPNAPQDLATTAANMRSKLGQHQRALDNLRQMALSTDDKDARQTILRRVRLANPDLADELERAARELQEGWLGTLPMVPLDFYIALGEKPSSVIDFRELATPHDLFGTEMADDSN
jgi:tetratricopeptide (TPR) repeat protein